MDYDELARIPKSRYKEQARHLEGILERLNKNLAAHNPLFILEDFVDFADGEKYIVVSQGEMALELPEGIQGIDISLIQIEKRVDKPGFYSVPILNSTDEIPEEYSLQPFRRCFVRSSHDALLYNLKDSGLELETYPSGYTIMSLQMFENICGNAFLEDVYFLLTIHSL